MLNKIVTTYFRRNSSKIFKLFYGCDVKHGQNKFPFINNCSVLQQYLAAPWTKISVENI